jgi:hypothetical protein
MAKLETSLVVDGRPGEPGEGIPNQPRRLLDGTTASNAWWRRGWRPRLDISGPSRAQDQLLIRAEEAGETYLSKHPSQRCTLEGSVVLSTRAMTRGDRWRVEIEPNFRNVYLHHTIVREMQDFEADRSSLSRSKARRWQLSPPIIGHHTGPVHCQGA